MCDVSGLAAARGLRAAARGRPGLASPAPPPRSCTTASASASARTSCRSARWVEIITAAHEVGLRSTVTVMFGHIETPAELAEHMRVVRDAAGAHRRLHRVRAAVVHPVPDAARPHARHRRDLARGEPQAHGGLPARAGQDDPEPAGELGEDGARRRHRGAALGRQRPRRDADGGVDLAAWRAPTTASSSIPTTWSPPPTAPAARPPSARRCTASAAATTSPPPRDGCLILGPLAAPRRRPTRRRCGCRPTAPCEVEVRPRAATPRERADVRGRGPPLRARARRPGCRADARRRTRSRSTASVVWPEPDSPFPPSVLRTHTPARAGADRLRLLPRRRAARAAATRCARTRIRRGREVDALRALALRMRAQPPEEWPHALLLLGDQVYADEVHPARRATRPRAATRSIADFDDYMQLYRAAWGEPVIRWLLSTVPSAMIFDDHDVHDDWNTSIEWVEEMRAEGLVARADRRRPSRATSSTSTSGNLSPRRARGVRALPARAHERRPDRGAAARVRHAAPTRRSRARAGASAATSGRRAW